MLKITFLASFDSDQILSVIPCEIAPEFIHMIKNYPDAGIELYFDADCNWTAQFEEAAENLLFSEILVTA